MRGNCLVDAILMEAYIHQEICSRLPERLLSTSIVFHLLFWSFFILKIIFTIEVNENKKLKYFIFSNKTDPLNQTTLHVPWLLVNERDDIILRFGNFLLKKLDHNFEFESLFKHDT